MSPKTFCPVAITFPEFQPSVLLGQRDKSVKTRLELSHGACKNLCLKFMAWPERGGGGGHKHLQLFETHSAFYSFVLPNRLFIDCKSYDSDGRWSRPEWRHQLICIAVRFCKYARKAVCDVRSGRDQRPLTSCQWLGRATHHALRTGPLSARPGYWCEGTFDRVFHGNELLMKMTRRQFNTTTESSLFYYFTILRALALP